jgi:hypothetical protein
MQSIDYIIFLLHAIYLVGFLIFIHNFKKINNENLILFYIFLYLILPGRFKFISIGNISFSNFYLILYLSPLLLFSLSKQINFFLLSKKKNINNFIYRNYSLAIYIIIFIYSVITYLNYKFENNYNLIPRIVNDYLDLIIILIFILCFFKKINYKKLALNFDKIIIFFSSIYLIEGLLYFFRLDLIKDYYDLNTFNSFFLNNYITTSIFSSFLIIFYIDKIIKKKNIIINIIFILTNFYIVFYNIESRTSVISLIICLIIFLLYNFLKKNLYFLKISILILFIPTIYFYLILTDDLICHKTYYKICSKESMLYRKIYLIRELDVFVHYLPLGVGPGIVSSKFHHSDIKDIFYPILTLNENRSDNNIIKKSHNKFFNDYIYTKEIYSGIKSDYFMNHQIMPTQEVSLFSKLFVQYGILPLMFLIIFLKKIKNLFIFSKISTYFLLIFFFNGLMNSTAGLGLIIITCIYLNYTTQVKNEKFL